MQHYIGTKMIEAKPMTRGAYNEYRGWQIPADENPDDPGYLVKYSDDYVSWSPAEVFEKAYLPVTVNDEPRTAAPSISEEMVDDFIVGLQIVTLGEKTTVLRAVLRNGFEIVESSSCVSAENYDEGVGADICLEKIKDKVWFLLGFLLQTAVNGIDKDAVRRSFEKENPRCGEDCAAEENTVSCDCCDTERSNTKLSFGQAIEWMRNGYKLRRAGWNGKNQHIELASGISYKNPAGEIINAEHDAIGNQAVAFVGTSGVQLGWLASQSDMLATDWEIVW